MDALHTDHLTSAKADVSSSVVDAGDAGDRAALLALAGECRALHSDTELQADPRDDDPLLTATISKRPELGHSRLDTLPRREP